MKSSLKIATITGSLGAIVEGLDLTKLDKQSLKTIIDSLDKFLVIKIPNQNLDRLQLSKLGSFFVHISIIHSHQTAIKIVQKFWNYLKSQRILKYLVEEVGMQI